MFSRAYDESTADLGGDIHFLQRASPLYIVFVLVCWWNATQISVFRGFVSRILRCGSRLYGQCGTDASSCLSQGASVDLE